MACNGELSTLGPYTLLTDARRIFEACDDIHSERYEEQVRRGWAWQQTEVGGLFQVWMADMSVRLATEACDS